MWGIMVSDGAREKRPRLLGIQVAGESTGSGEGARVASVAPWLSDTDDFASDGRGERYGPDPREADAVADLSAFFQTHRDQVFFSRQLEVQNEEKYFHWITNRALRELRTRGVLLGETRLLSSGGSINLLWHRSHRFYKRSSTRLVRLVEEYADPNIGGALGLHGEAMVLEGFARSQFVMRGRNTRSFAGRTWEGGEQNLDFIFERDGIAYGVEVKNTLGYLDHDEFDAKTRLCQFLGLNPVFAVRMLPKTWINDLNQERGFALVMKFQLYPWTHKELARRVKAELGLPVDAPRALADGTMKRFLDWHVGHL